MAHPNPSAASASSGLQQYLQEIGRTPLLTAAQEQQLARRIQKTQDRRSRQRMIQANLRLVVHIAKRYAPTNQLETLLDLIQEGNVGLVHAVDRFKPEYQVRFSTYGVYWIKQSILRAVKSNRLIRLPESVTTRIKTMRHEHQRLSHELGRSAQQAEVAQAMSLSVSEIDRLEGVTAKTISLNEPVRSRAGEENTDLQEVTEDTGAPHPSSVAHQEWLQDSIRAAVATLPSRQMEIVTAYFGLSGSEPHTLEEVGHQFGISRERVRQIQNIALQRLQSYPNVQQLGRQTASAEVA